MLKHLRGKVQLKKSGDGITVIMSDETLDRHGDVLPIDQWDLTKFIGSPRMLVDHNHEVGSIVGRWENVRIENKALIADANFHDFTDLARAVKQMVENDYLDTVSVGFIPHSPKEDGGRESFELIETSWVTVPANPSARTVKELLEKHTPEEQILQVKGFIGEKDEEKIEESTPVVDMTPQGMEEMGWKILKSIEDYREWDKIERAGHPDGLQNCICVCETLFIEKLIKDSEQLMTLTAENKKKVENAKRDKLMRSSLKAAASHMSHLLRDLNKSSL